MKDLSYGSHNDGDHPRLFSQADATWLAHDFNANSRDFREIVFAANGAGARREVEPATTVYRSRVPEKYVGLYFCLPCPVQGCSFRGIPLSRAISELSKEVGLPGHLRKDHGWSSSESYAAEKEGSA